MQVPNGSISIRSSVRLVLAAAIASMLLAAAGCGPGTMLLGVGARAGVAATEDRGIDGTLSDAAIQIEVNKRWLNSASENFWALSTLVRDGRVLVVGTVDSEAERADAIALAASVDGVVEVIDEIVVGGGRDLIDNAQDSLISSRLESRLLFDNEVKSVNFAIMTHDAQVFIMGYARSQWEADRVVAHARNVQYVRRVVSHATVATP